MPLLIPCHCTHAVPVIRLVSENANAKEILLVLQEILERLVHDDEQEDDEGEEESENLPPTLQLDRVVFSYAYGEIASHSTTAIFRLIGRLVIPRVLPGEKSTGERLRGILHDLGKYIQILVPRSQPSEGQAVLHSVTTLTNNLLDYFADHLSDAMQLTPCIVSKICIGARSGFDCHKGCSLLAARYNPRGKRKLFTHVLGSEDLRGFIPETSGKLRRRSRVECWREACLGSIGTFPCLCVVE